MTELIWPRLPRFFARPFEARRGRCGGARAWVVLGVASVLGCGGPDERAPLLGAGRAIAGCEGFAYRACDVLTPRCQTEVFALAACLYGERDPGEVPPVQQLDEASAIALIAAASNTGMTDGIDAMNDMGLDAAAFRAEARGRELVGLLEPGVIGDPGDLLDASVSSAVAFYLQSTREIIIIDRGEPVNDLEANGVLAHEFVHALQDRRHGLGSLEAGVALDSDGYLALDGLIEGEASIYQYLLTFAYQGVNIDAFDFSAFFSDLTGLALEVTIEAGSPAVTASSIFPYTFGARYAGVRWVAGGSGAVDALYDAPPRSSWEVLGGTGSPGIATFAEAPAPLEGHSLVSDDVAGAWLSVAMLAGLEAGRGAADELLDLASRWRGDRLWIYASAEASFAALWALEWSDADSAARFGTLAAELSPEGSVVRIDTTGVSTRITAVERSEDLEAWRAALAAVAR